MNRRSLLASALALASLPAYARSKADRPFDEDSSSAQAIAARDKRPNVYLLRGFGDIFSTGIDEIGASLQASGVDAQVKSHTAWRFIANRIVSDRAKYGPQATVLIGHSLGANAIISTAEVLEKKDIRVDYIASFAATAPDPLPGNIRWAVNFYFSQDGWGRALEPGPRFNGKLDNRDFSDVKDVGHFNIEKQRPLQAEVVRNVLSIVK
ncbi:lipase [Brucella sp. BE17]|uniref:lipase n=1 Tax=Brucella sp. BE17 TaxID=3142977 RepID=UPI0031B9F990